MPFAEPRQLLNNYLDLLWSVHVAKFDELCESLIESVNSRQFLLYGLIGRSLIEHTGIMRYYFKHRLKPTVKAAVNTGMVTLEQIQIIISELDQFLRGNRFDWNAYLNGKSSQFSKESEKYSGSQRQVNILTCLEKWEKEKPGVINLYELFCDLVHPNIGSTLLVMNTWPDGIGFGGVNTQKVGQGVMNCTIADIVELFSEIQMYLNLMHSLKMPIEDGV